MNEKDTQIFEEFFQDVHNIELRIEFMKKAQEIFRNDREEEIIKRFKESFSKINN